MPDPNLLLIYVDQMRFDALGCAGNREVLTPHLDALASQGVRFSHCFVQHPLCMPSRYSMLTGRYPSSLGVTHMGVPVPEDAEVLPRMLGRHGYATAQIGKLHFLPHANRDHRLPHPNYGFDHLEISDEPGVYHDAYRAWVSRHHPEELSHIAQVAHPPALERWCEVMAIQDSIERPRDLDPYGTRAYPGREEATHTSWVTQRTELYLESRAADRRPFCCISGYYNPHSPLIAPQRFLDMYRGRVIEPWSFPPELEAERLAAGITDERIVQAKVGYYAMVSEVDEAVGQLVRTLDRLGLTDDTLVVFTSDHGEFLGEHLRWGKGYPAPDCVTRVPLILAGPGIKGGGRHVDRLVEAVDLLPTVLDALGKTRPPQLEGASRWATLQWLDSPCDDEFALTEDIAWKALRTPEHRYILHRDGREELFDMRSPFGEYRDLSGHAGAAQTISRLRHQLLTHLFEKERALPRTWPY
ncbi:MAG TPA: sulfatase-like hydrolase/transferase [Tepidisphaeraceae bacterium]|jgi:arylsulfatase A-like enzyme|nr:sulfatase-like hydrolase/transferase [Tepidisphaeraceae bacterium]